MRVVIAGGGIGGLTLAAALQGDSSITVVEKRSEVSGIGAGLLLHDAALSHLKNAGIEVSGRRFNQMNLGLANGRSLPSVKKAGLAISRPALHGFLLSACDGVDFRTSTVVESFKEDGSGVDIRLSDGCELRADLLIGADGLGSDIRRLHGAKTRRRYSGVTCWRALSQSDSSEDNPIEIWGHGQRVGIVPLERGTYLYLTESAAPNQSRIPAPIERFSHFSYDAPSLIESVSRDDWTHHDLDELDLHYWGTARVPLLGDAAHGFTPNLGEGAAQAILDAALLAQSLRSGELYPGHRRRVNSRIAFLSRWMGRIAQANGWAGMLRDITLRPIASKRTT